MLLVLAGVVVAPFLFTLAGDAQVHLAVAENFAVGRPFQYNPKGEMVVASTSPFWTLLLTFAYYVIGYNAPILLKVVVVLLWLGSGYALYRILVTQWSFSMYARWGILALWLGHTTVVANAVGGLENVLSAFQLTWLYLIAAVSLPRLRYYHTFLMGLLLGWAWLTRPDGGLFALVILCFWFWYGPQSWLQRLKHLLLLSVMAVVVLVPWYMYQFDVTGQLLTDSSVARLYTGRQGAWPLWPGQLYVHPKAFISLVTAFLPLLLGFGLMTWTALTRMVARLRSQTVDASQPSHFALITAVALVIFPFLFYTFVVGAEAFGRYFLPVYPFLFVAGAAGWQRIHHWVQLRQTWLAWVGTVFASLFLLGSASFDYYRRVTNPAPAVQALDVIYGPARQQYFSYNLWPTLVAPPQRYEQTHQLLQQLGLPTEADVKLAVTEVQLRYFVDDRIEIMSLDGRTSATILNYFDPDTGLPDFERYFTDQQPDLVHVNQWCAVGGWLAAVRPVPIADNLVCRWQHQTERLAVGESFEWNGRVVTVVAPEIVYIDWSQS